MDRSKKPAAVPIPIAPVDPMTEVREKFRAALLEASASTDAQSADLEARLLEIQRRLMVAISEALATHPENEDGTPSS